MKKMNFYRWENKPLLISAELHGFKKGAEGTAPLWFQINWHIIRNKLNQLQTSAEIRQIQI